MGVVEDFCEMGDIKNYLEQRLDHKMLNDWVAQPTAEKIACKLFCKFKDRHPLIKKVRVWESPRSWAEYDGDELMKEKYDSDAVK